MLQQETTAAPLAASEPPYPPATHGFFHHLIVGNYFYFLSAALMLAGCYHMMHSLMVSPDAGPKIFAHTLKTLRILQGYELLVIAAALMIVWRLRRLDDAFSLLLIELLLLLDPTFFTNAFFTMYKTENTLLSGPGVAVNAVCLALVPLKLGLLMWGVRLRLARGGWAAYLFAAVFAYLAEAPLCRRIPLAGFSPSAYHYLLSWAPLLFACLLPPLRRAVTARGGAEGYVSAGRLFAIGVALCLFPLVVIVAHLIESLRVHDMFLYPFALAPVVLAGAVLIVRQAGDGPAFGRKLLYLCDGFALAALGLTLIRRSSLESRTVMGYAAQPLPVFAAAHIPQLLTALAVIGLYAWLYRRYRCRAALYRIAFVALAGGAGALWSFELTRVMVGALGLGLRKCGAAALSGGAQVIHGIGSACASAAGWLAGLCTRLAHGVGQFCLAAFATLKPMLMGILRASPELIQAGLIALIVLDRRRQKPRLSSDSVVSLVLIIILIGLVRYGMMPAWWSATVCMIECGLMIAAGLRRATREFLLFAVIQGVIFIMVSLVNDTWLARTASQAAEHCGAWFDAHPQSICWGAWVAALALSIRFHRAFTWFPLGLLTIWLASGWLPRGREYWVPEIVQAVLIWGLVMDHRFNANPLRGARYFIAGLVAFASIVHCAGAPGTALGLIVICESLLLFTAAVWLLHPGYLAVGSLQIAAFVCVVWDRFTLGLSTTTMVMGGGLAFFAVGLAVTFNKERLLRWSGVLSRRWALMIEAPPVEKPAPETAQEEESHGVAEAPPEVPKPAAESVIKAPAATAAEILKTEEAAQAIRQKQAARHLRAKLKSFFDDEPDFTIALRRDLPPDLLEKLDAAAIEELSALAELHGPHSVYLIKDGMTSDAWNVTPAWICYPEEKGD